MGFGVKGAWRVPHLEAKGKLPILRVRHFEARPFKLWSWMPLASGGSGKSWGEWVAGVVSLLLNLGVIWVCGGCAGVCLLWISDFTWLTGGVLSS